MARLIVGASPAIQRCSASIRRIESEVLFGTPCLAQFPEEKIRIREFPSAAVVSAQQALRISAVLLRQEGLASSQPIPPPPPPGEVPHAEPSGPPPKRRENTVSTSSSAGQDLPKPPIDFDAVVNHLVGEVGAIEEAWVSALVATQGLTKKAVADVSRYMVLAKLLSEDAGEASPETTVTKFPLPAEDIALLKPRQSISDNPGQIFLPELYVIRDIIDMLTAMNPSQGEVPRCRHQQRLPWRAPFASFNGAAVNAISPRRRSSAAAPSHGIRSQCLTHHLRQHTSQVYPKP